MCFRVYLEVYVCKNLVLLRHRSTDPKKSDVSELDYHGYKLKVVPVKTTDGVPTGVHTFMYLDDHTCLWVKYEPETESIKNLNKEELVKLATKVLDELVTIKKK